MSKEPEPGRPIKIDGMAYAPTNEQGVVFLFGRLAPRLGFQVEYVQVGFPDCWARRRGKSFRIEFEFWASHYNHPPTADVIVCWENDLETRPRKYRHIEIIDLKKYVGAHPRIFAVGCDEKVRGSQLNRGRVDWSVPQRAQIGDLILMYRKPSGIRDLWRVTGPFYDDKKWGREGFMRCVVRLAKPLTFAALKWDPTTRDLGAVRARFRGKRDITEDWPLLYERIVGLNPKAKKPLRPWHFDRWDS